MDFLLKKKEMVSDSPPKLSKLTWYHNSEISNLTKMFSIFYYFHTMSGLLLKATLNQNRHFSLILPIFWCPIEFDGHFLNFWQNTRHISLWDPLCLCVLLCAVSNLGYFLFWGAHPQKGPKTSSVDRKQPSQDRTPSRKAEELNVLGYWHVIVSQILVCLSPKM